MATRRVKRIKRTKKQVHRARDRKTNRRHQTNRHRYTRRQRGGTKIEVCKRTGADILGNSKGIAITYDTDSQMYTIGNHSYETLKKNPRYTDALAWVELMFGRDNIKLPHDEPVVLNQEQFNRFKNNHCPQGSTKPECGSITRFIPPAASAAPVAADVPSTCQAHVEKKGVPNSLILTETPSCIAYINHAKLVGLQTLTSKPTYVFENFTIPLHDETVITGKLTIDLANGETQSFELILDLNGRENTNTPAFIDCMNGLKQCGTVTVTAVRRKSTIFSKDKLTVNGTVELGKKDNALFVSNFQTFVTKFADQYKFCTTPIGQNLENAEEINRLDAGALVLLIKGQIKTLDTQSTTAQYEKLKQMYLDFMQKYPNPNDTKVATPQNLATLNAIHGGMTALLDRDVATAMSQLTLGQTGDELAAKLAALKDD
jgi:hypothetical protein